MLKEEVGSLVIDFLTDLNLRLPQMRRVNPFAIITLQVLHLEFNHKSLLNLGIAHHFFLNGKFDLELPRVWLCPNKLCIDHLDPAETFDMLQAELQQLW